MKVVEDGVKLIFFPPRFFQFVNLRLQGWRAPPAGVFNYAAANSACTRGE